MAKGAVRAKGKDLGAVKAAPPTWRPEGEPQAKGVGLGLFAYN